MIRTIPLDFGLMAVDNFCVSPSGACKTAANNRSRRRGQRLQAACRLVSGPRATGALCFCAIKGGHGGLDLNREEMEERLAGCPSQTNV